MNIERGYPAKRQKLANGTTHSQGYDSQNDSGEEIFDDFETVATVPLSPKPKRHPASTDIISSPPAHITQPTQILSDVVPLQRNNNAFKDSQVQVPASSPILAPATASPTHFNRSQGSMLASSIAPAGTSFRPPLGTTKAPPTASKPPPIVDISDDELPTYHDSSDEGSQSHRRANIKPSTFITSLPKNVALEPMTRDEHRFKEITAKSFYNPLDNSAGPQSNASKRSADVMATAYGSARRPGHKQPQQKGLAKALPKKDIDINSIEDFQLRSKIQRMRHVLPQCTISACKDALEFKKFNYDDAVDHILSHENDFSHVDLTVSDAEDPLSMASPSALKKQPAKQQVKVKQNIQEKWTATQLTNKDKGPRSPAETHPSPAPVKPKRRLVQGRKHASSPIKSTTPPTRRQPVATTTSPARSLSLDPEASDSAIGSELDTQLESKVLHFFNTCSPIDLADIAMISREVATTLLSQGPFNSLDGVRQIHGDTSTKSMGKKSTKKPIGDKIVDKCLDMWTAYEAIDKLVERCEEISKPLKADMNQWGVNIFAASSEGELELTSFSRDHSPRDSGIGTPKSDLDDSDIRKGNKRHGLFSQPSNMAEGISLKDYQIVGINWLSLLFEKGLSCILADDMGLGKTCQVIAFFAHLLSKGVKGPHLVIVPGSTLENWLREFSVFCPELHVMPYYASQNERPGIQAQMLESRDTLNVVITTYTLAKQRDDNKFLRKLKPTVCVYDEGHLLKNSKSAGYEAYMRIPSQFRLLLTGTPLQNNLRELTSLLGFILPSVFKDHSEDLEAIFSHKAKTMDDSHAALLSEQRISRAKSIMTPFVLRRKKHQVLRHLPPKVRRIEYCDLSTSQSDLYRKEEEKARRIVAARAAGDKTGNETSNILMALRKASIHPLLFRRLYDDALLLKMSKSIVKEEQFRDSNVNFVFDDMEVMTDMELYRLCEANPRTMSSYLLHGNDWMDSGKVKKLASLLERYKQNGDRVLVFSQFTMVMDVLERVMETLGMKYFRLDGQTNINERQTMIDEFYEKQDITVFLLSTKAGGAGINLACSNKVIIFDSSFNPQDDIQAENRAHRVGQTKEVEVVRLVTRNTIEEQIHALGETKLALDDKVAGIVADDVDDKKHKMKEEKEGAKIVEALMISKFSGELDEPKSS